MIYIQTNVPRHHDSCMSLLSLLLTSLSSRSDKAVGVLKANCDTFQLSTEINIEKKTRLQLIAVISLPMCSVLLKLVTRFVGY